MSISTLMAMMNPLFTQMIRIHIVSKFLYIHRGGAQAGTCKKICNRFLGSSIIAMKSGGPSNCVAMKSIQKSRQPRRVQSSMGQPFHSLEAPQLRTTTSTMNPNSLNHIGNKQQKVSFSISEIGPHLLYQRE